ncbi:MAG: lipoyl domain-containing protein [Candidatus Bipolaricaulaceae bacterium]
MEITVPPLGDVEAVTVVRWLKAAGDQVRAGEAVAEVEAAKAVFVVESPAGGRLTEIRVQAGDTARPGQVLGLMEPG